MAALAAFFRGRNLSTDWEAVKQGRPTQTW